MAETDAPSPVCESGNLTDTAARGPTRRPERRPPGTPTSESTSDRPRPVALLLATVAAITFALVVLTAGPAAAHATLVNTSPADGSGGERQPTSVSATFDEAVQIDAGSLRVFGPSGALVNAGPASHGGGSESQVTATLPTGLARGTYTVSWRVISADSHPVQGAFTFWVGAPGGKAPALTGGSARHGLGVVYGVLRWLAFAGFALLVGAAAFVLCCWSAGSEQARVRWLLVGGWVGLVLASVGIVLVQGPYALGSGGMLDSAVLRETLASRLGTALIVRLLLLGVAAGYLAWLLGRAGLAAARERRWLGACGAALAVCLAATWALGDHASTGIQRWLAVPVDVLHLLAMATWLGGLAVLGFALLRPGVGPAVRTAGGAGPGDAGVVAVNRFSSIALGCVATLVATGAYQVWRQVGTPPALAATTYGRLLLFKLGVFAVLIGAAWLSRDWVRRAARQRQGSGRPVERGAAVADVGLLRRSVLAEALLATVVLAVTALLVDAAPARSAYAVPVSANVRFDTGGAGGAGSLVLALDPARIGPNALHVEVLGDDGRPRAVPEVRAALTLPSRGVGPLPITLTPAEPGFYHAPGVVVPMAGEWRLDVTVRTSAIDETTVSVPARVR